MITIYTTEGTFTFDPNTVTDGELALMGTKREYLPEQVTISESPDVVILKKYLADPHSGLPDLDTAFQALARLYLGIG